MWLCPSRKVNPRSRGIAATSFKNGSCARGDSRSFKRDSARKGEPNAQNMAKEDVNEVANVQEDRNKCRKDSSSARGQRTFKQV